MVIGEIMNVYFRDSNGKKRFLQSAPTEDFVWKIIKKFLDDHNFKSYYTRTWFADGYTWYDVGSHTEFFLVDENLMGQYENEQEDKEEEKDILRVRAKGNATNHIGYRPE